MKLLDQLQALAPLAAQADTAAPWAFTPAHDYDGWSLVREEDLDLHHSGTALDFASIAEINDAAFIAAARNLLTPENLTLLVAAVAILKDEATALLTDEQCESYRSNSVRASTATIFNRGYQQGAAKLALHLLNFHPAR